MVKRVSAAGVSLHPLSTYLCGRRNTLMPTSFDRCIAKCLTTSWEIRNQIAQQMAVWCHLTQQKQPTAHTLLLRTTTQHSWRLRMDYGSAEKYVPPTTSRASRLCRCYWWNKLETINYSFYKKGLHPRLYQITFAAVVEKEQSHRNKRTSTITTTHTHQITWIERKRERARGREWWKMRGWKKTQSFC